MKKIRICKADPISFGEKIESCTIIIDDKLPFYTNLETVEKTKEFYEDQARMINDALYNSLPQGIYDRLGIRFMSQKISLYRGKTGT